MKPRGIKITVDVDTSQAERARDVLKEIVSIAKKAGLSKRSTRKLLKMQMTKDNNQRHNGYQPTEEIQTEPPNCASAVQSTPPICVNCIGNPDSCYECPHSIDRNDV